MRARRNRWIVSAIGLAVAFAIISWAFRTNVQNDYVPMAGFALAIGSIFYFFLATAILADEVRNQLMAKLAAWMGLSYEAVATGFDLDRFALLGLAKADNARHQDRLFGIAGGLAADVVAARLTDQTTEGIGSERHTRTIERFIGLLMRFTDPTPPGIVFRLVPPESATPHGMLRGYSRSVNTAGLTKEQIRAAFAAPTSEEAPASPTGMRISIGVSNSMPCRRICLRH